MQNILLSLFLILSTTAYSQEKNVTTSHGWVINVGDILNIGRGSMPDKTFAFIYQSPAGFYSKGDTYNKRTLDSYHSGKNAKVKRIFKMGTKKRGFTDVVVVGVGGAVNYYVEIENAIEAGEVIPPDYIRAKMPSKVSGSQPLSIADEIKKLKELKDSGILTEQEYESQKEKLLNKN